MTEAWAVKGERQYERVKQPVLDHTRSERQVSQVAAGFANGSESRIEARRTAGTGNPRAPLEERSRDELYNLAEENDIKGRSRMNKTQLIAAIRRRVGSDL